MPAPRGNKNALKHGLYAKRIKPDQNQLLKGIDTLDLEDEVIAMRATIDNILEDIDTLRTKAKDATLIDINIYVALSGLYNSLFTGMGQLTTTIKAHALLHGDHGEIQKQIEEGLIFARQRLNVYNYLTTSTPKQKPKRSVKKDSKNRTRSK